MKLKISLISTTLLCMFGFASSGFCLSAGTVLPAMDQPATPVELGAEINSLVFTGVAKRIPDGTALITKNGTYLLEGGNFDSIINREVNIIGRLIRQGSIEVIKVSRTQLAQE